MHEETVYPKWKYHATKAPEVVGSEEEEKALGEGWGESPAEFESKPVKNEKETDSDEQSDGGEKEPPASEEKPKPRARGNKTKASE